MEKYRKIPTFDENPNNFFSRHDIDPNLSHNVYYGPGDLDVKSTRVDGLTRT